MTEELFFKVCDEIEQTERGLDKICKEHDSSATAFYNMIDDNEAEGDKRFAERYARARERQAEYLFDLQREIVFKRDQDLTPFTGGNVVQRDKLIAETIKWQAGKLKPKKYGDKLDITTDGDKIQSIPLVLKDGKSLDDLMDELKPE